MKRVLLLAGLALLLSHLALAQSGSICLYSDASGSDCSISDIAPGLIQVHVIHQFAAGVLGVRFAAPVPPCMNAVWLGDMTPFPTILGDSQNGISIGYGACQSSPINIMTINIFGQGLSAADCPYPVIPDPDTDVIEVVDCDANLLVGSGGITYVNSMIPCQCGTSSPDPILYVYPSVVDLGTEGTEGAFSITNIGGGTLNWSVSESAPWLDLSPTSGSQGGTVTVTADRAGLPAGHHSALVEVTSNAGSETVTVELDVEIPEPLLGVTPVSMSFSPTVTAKYLNIFNAGTGDLTWSLTTDQTWLTTNVSSGINDTSVLVSVDRTALPDGTYNGNILISSNGGSGSVPVTMEVSTQPQLAVTPTRLDFSMTTTSRVFQISNVGFGTLEWTVSTNTSWVEIVPPLSGTGDKYLTVNVNPANVPAGGQQYGYVYVASNGGDAHVEIVYTPPGPTFGGTIGVYSMADGADCNIHDLAPGLLKVYVVHTGIVAATASQFFAPMPSCMTGAAWLSDDPQFPVALGNSQTGIAIAYGGCMPSPIHILTINYFAGGTTQECCYYPVLPNPSVVSGQIEVVNCDEHLVYADGLVSVVNPVMGCYCGVIKVKETTWGKVKSLYAPSSDQINRR